MNPRMIGALVGAVLAFAAPAHAVLVTPQGKPVGGMYQRWVNQSRMPTVNGAVEMMGATICQGAAGCSDYYPGARTAVLHATDRSTLYFELGHLYDFENLTWRERGRLARVWGVKGHPWRDSISALNAGREDGLEVDFAAAYEACALGKTVTGLAAGDAPAIQMRDTCALIRHG